MEPEQIEDSEPIRRSLIVNVPIEYKEDQSPETESEYSPEISSENSKDDQLYQNTRNNAKVHWSDVPSRQD